MMSAGLYRAEEGERYPYCERIDVVANAVASIYLESQRAVEIVLIIGEDSLSSESDQTHSVDAIQ